MFTQTSLQHPTFQKHIKQTLWLCKLEACKTKKRCTKYVQNRNGRNVIRLDVYPTGDMAAYVSGHGSKDFTSIVLRALEK